MDGHALSEGSRSEKGRERKKEIYRRYIVHKAHLALAKAFSI